MGTFNVAFHPLEYKLGNAARTIQRNHALANVCHAEKTLVEWPGKDRGGVQAQTLANAGAAQHNAHRKRVGQVDQLFDSTIAQQHYFQQFAALAAWRLYGRGMAADT